MEKIDNTTEDVSLVVNEQDPLSDSIKKCIDKINEIIDWINSQ